MSSTESPSKNPTSNPTIGPTASPSVSPSRMPSLSPSVSPTVSPTGVPSSSPSENPSTTPSQTPSEVPSSHPSSSPSLVPTSFPSVIPSTIPSWQPSTIPSLIPSDIPSLLPSNIPSQEPSQFPSLSPTRSPEQSPTASPTVTPSDTPSQQPSQSPSLSPTNTPEQSPTTSPIANPTQSPTISCGTRGNIVKIESTTGQPINVFEVQVYSSGENVAMGKEAKQSSIPRGDDGTMHKSFAASRAVDGSFSTFSKTDDGDASPMWQVDLGDTYLVERVQIFNRYCIDKSDPDGCLCRLSNATISVVDTETNDVTSKPLSGTCNILSVSESFAPDKPGCERDSFVVSSVAKTQHSDQTDDDAGGSTGRAIAVFIIGIGMFLGLALLVYRGRKRVQQQQRKDRYAENINISSFVRRGRRQRSQGLHRKASGQQILDQLEDNSLMVNVRTTETGGWNCTFDEDALEDMAVRSPSASTVDNERPGSLQDLEEIENSVHDVNSKEPSDEELVRAMHDAMKNDVEPENEAFALAEKYAPTVQDNEDEDASLGHEIT